MSYNDSPDSRVALSDAMRRDQERERRRIRDKERRQAMNVEERERHLAKRRRNYRLRRRRADNTQLGSDEDEQYIGHVGEKLTIFNRRLKLSQVRHLARTLDNSQRNLFSAYLFSGSIPTSNPASHGKLRLTQVKSLARELNSTMNDATAHLRQLTARNSKDGVETPPSLNRSQHNIAELVNKDSQDEPSLLLQEDIFWTHEADAHL